MQQSLKKDQYIHDKALKKYPKDKEKQNKHIQENRKETLEVFNEYLLWPKSIKEKVDMKPKFTTTVNYILNDEEALRKYLPYSKEIPNYWITRTLKKLKNKIRELKNNLKGQLTNSFFVIIIYEALSHLTLTL